MKWLSITYLLFISIYVSAQWSGTYPDEWRISPTNDGYRAMNHGFYNIDSNRTFMFWVGNNMDSYGADIDHDDGIIHDSVKLCTNTAEDGHFYPNGIVLHTGHVMTVSGYNQQMEVCISNYPYTLDSGVTCSQPGITYFDYPKIFQTEFGRIFIFFSQSFRDAIDCSCSGHSKDEESYIYSDDNGTTWIKRTSTRGQYMFERWDETDWMNEMYIGPYILDTIGDTEKLWAVYTLSGGAVHDQYHADLYCFYVKFDSASVGKPVKLYAPDGTDLDTLIDQTEMETYCMVLDTQGTGKAYPSYVNTVAINDSGYPLVNGLYYYNGTSHLWDSINTTTRINTTFMDHKYYTFTGSTIDTSSDGTNYGTLSGYNMTNIPTGTNVVEIAVTNTSHPNARLWMGRWGASLPDGGQGYCGEPMDSVPFILDVTANCPNVKTSDTAKINCYIRDSLGGKVTWDDSQVTFSMTGDGQLIGNTTQTTVNGVATVYYLAPGTNGSAIISVTSSTGLIGDKVNMYPSTTGIETSFYYYQESQQQEPLPKKIGNYRIGNYFYK